MRSIVKRLALTDNVSNGSTDVGPIDLDGAGRTELVGLEIAIELCLVELNVLTTKFLPSACACNLFLAFAARMP